MYKTTIMQLTDVEMIRKHPTVVFFKYENQQKSKIFLPELVYLNNSYRNIGTKLLILLKVAIPFLLKSFLTFLPKPINRLTNTEKFFINHKISVLVIKNKFRFAFKLGLSIKTHLAISK